METNEVVIEIPIEYKRLFNTDWREAAIYGGRFCFDGSTLISLFDGRFKRIDDIAVGEKVLCMGGGYDIVSSVDSFKANFDPKPMFELEINGTITKTTYDHKYFNGRSYVPIYQLVWGIMDSSQRRTLQLLCKQYGENTHNELQGWIQNPNYETIDESRIFCDGSRKEKSKDTQSNSKNIYIKSREQGDSKPQERYKNGQQGGELRVGNTSRTIDTSLEDRATERPSYTGQQLQKDKRERGKRIITISLRKSEGANSNDVGTSTGENWTEICWDKRFAEWKNLEIPTSRLSSQKTDSVGGENFRVRIKKVYESVDVWCIETEKYHNYFANGVNVSNSGKSHTVARYLLLRGRMAKTRIACFREFQSSIAESSHQLLHDLIKLYKLTDYKVTDKSIVNTVTGSDFIFKGLWNNEQSIKSIEGIDIAWVEEAQTVTRESLDVLTPTIRKSGSQIIYTYNRLNEDDPVHQRLVLDGRPNTLVINVNYDIMLKYGMMPEVIRIEMEDDKLKRPNLYKTKWLGEPSIGEDAFFDRDALDRQVAIQPIKTSVNAKVFKEFVASHRVAGGHDVAGGVGLDSSASVFIDFDTFPAQVVLTYHSNKIRPADFGHEIARQGNMYGSCLVAPENNKFDEAIGILKLIYPISRIYTTKGSHSKIFDTNISTFGWNTNGLTKSKMLNDLGAAIEDGLISLNDIDLINEARGYSRNNLMDRDIDVRKVTRHFDLLIACAIAWQMKDHAVRPSHVQKLNAIDSLFVKKEVDRPTSFD